MHDDLVLSPGAGKLVWLADLGVRFMMTGAQTDGRFALVEHPIRPKALAAPVHTHTNEDEISYVLEGEMGLQIGKRVLQAGPGALVFKPRGVPHAFWNPGDAPPEYWSSFRRPDSSGTSRKQRTCRPADLEIPMWPRSYASATTSRSTSRASRGCCMSTDSTCRPEGVVSQHGSRHAGVVAQVGRAER